jgi:hypothetical protein
MGDSAVFSFDPIVSNAGNLCRQAIELSLEKIRDHGATALSKTSVFGAFTLGSSVGRILRISPVSVCEMKV